MTEVVLFLIFWAAGIAFLGLLVYFAVKVWGAAIGLVT